MATLTLYFIGTNHNKDEEANILVLLNKLTAGLEIETNNYNVEQAQLDTIGSNKGEDIHALFTGVGGDGNKWDQMADAQSVMAKISNSALQIVRKFIETNAKDDNINLVGHSRGAVTVINLVMSIFSDATIMSKTPVVNTFLIDAVKLPTEFPNLELASGVNECYHIVMEDENSKLGPKLVFKLMDVRWRDPRKSIISIRLPGTHGTASQCNKVTNSGEISSVGNPQDMWPIGSVALRTILIKLKEWGTPLENSDHIKNYLDTKYLLLNYTKILTNNKVEYSSAKVVRRLNDSEFDKDNHELKQQINDIDLTKYNKMNRYEYFKDNNIQNKYRFSRVFVNEYHKYLFCAEINIEKYPNLHTEITGLDPDYWHNSDKLKEEIVKLNTDGPLGPQILEALKPLKIRVVGNNEPAKFLGEYITMAIKNALH